MIYFFFYGTDLYGSWTAELSYKQKAWSDTSVLKKYIFDINTSIHYFKDQ